MMSADALVMALPTTMVRRIAFAPSLPVLQRHAFQDLRYGPATKTLLQFDRRFWRGPGRTLAYGTELPIGAMWDGNEEAARRGRHPSPCLRAARQVVTHETAHRPRWGRGRGGTVEVVGIDEGRSARGASRVMGKTIHSCGAGMRCFSRGMIRNSEPGWPGRMDACSSPATYQPALAGYMNRGRRKRTASRGRSRSAGGASSRRRSPIGGR